MDSPKFKVGDIIKVLSYGTSGTVYVLEITGYKLQHQHEIYGSISNVYEVLTLAGNTNTIYADRPFLDKYGTKFCETSEIARKLYSLKYNL